MTVSAPTRPTLLSIEQGDRTITFAARGEGHKGLVWTIQPGQPEALARAIAMVNEFGGPNLWRITSVPA